LAKIAKNWFVHVRQVLVGIYLCSAQEYGADVGLNVLQKAHHFPNRLNVYIGSVLLKNPDIWTRFVEWMRTWNGYDPSMGWEWPTKSMISEMGFDKLKI
jgi:hypothetical protein